MVRKWTRVVAEEVARQGQSFDILKFLDNMKKKTTLLNKKEGKERRKLGI